MFAERFAPLQSRFATGLAQRALLLFNHLLRREPMASLRLAAHAGRRIELQCSGAPAWWPIPPLLRIEVTRAGLLDAELAPSEQPDLRIVLDLANPLDRGAALLAGDLSEISLAGDAALADDIRWLLDNLRWDVADDLERVVGPAAAFGIARAGSGLAALARDALGALASLRGGPAAR